jgi:hypothetical protein
MFKNSRLFALLKAFVTNCRGEFKTDYRGSDSTGEVAPGCPAVHGGPNALEVLEWLRNSFKGISERETLTEADPAVLVAVEITLEHLAKSG